jgi:phenylacetate-CoA ligase
MTNYRTNKNIEPTCSIDNIKQIQLTQLKKTITYAAQHSPYYKEKLKNITINSLKDIENIPFTSKEDISADGSVFQCVPESDIVEIATTSGSTGKPIIGKLTSYDMERLGYNEFLNFHNAGLTKDDTVLLAVTMDKCFIAGLAYYMGLIQLGCSVVRVGTQLPELLLTMARDTNATAIIGVPSYLIRIMEYAKQHNIDTSVFPLNKFILIGEPIRHADFSLNALGKKLSDLWGCSLYSTYGMTELQTAFCECQAENGGHVHPELIYTEIVDEDGKVLPPGEHGEIVATTFDINAMPVIRYKTGDISFLIHEPCACGLHTPRLGPIVGRKSQKLKIKGTTIYPSAIFDILDETADIANYVLIITSVNTMSDAVEIKYNLSPSSSLTESMLKDKLQGRLKITPLLSQTDVSEIMKLRSSVSNRKLTKIVDRR